MTVNVEREGISVDKAKGGLIGLSSNGVRRLECCAGGVKERERGKSECYDVEGIRRAERSCKAKQ